MNSARSPLGQAGKSAATNKLNALIRPRRRFNPAGLSEVATHVLCSWLKPLIIMITVLTVVEGASYLDSRNSYQASRDGRREYRKRHSCREIREVNEAPLTQMIASVVWDGHEAMITGNVTDENQEQLRHEMKAHIDALVEPINLEIINDADFHLRSTTTKYQNLLHSLLNTFDILEKYNDMNGDGKKVFNEAVLAGLYPSATNKEVFILQQIENAARTCKAKVREAIVNDINLYQIIDQYRDTALAIGCARGEDGRFIRDTEITLQRTNDRIADKLSGGIRFFFELVVEKLNNRQKVTEMGLGHSNAITTPLGYSDNRNTREFFYRKNHKQQTYDKYISFHDYYLAHARNFNHFDIFAQEMFTKLGGRQPGNQLRMTPCNRSRSGRSCLDEGISVKKPTRAFEKFAGVLKSMNLMELSNNAEEAWEQTEEYFELVDIACTNIKDLLRCTLLFESKEALQEGLNMLVKTYADIPTLADNRWRIHMVKNNWAMYEGRKKGSYVDVKIIFETMYENKPLYAEVILLTNGLHDLKEASHGFYDATRIMGKWVGTLVDDIVDAFAANPEFEDQLPRSTKIFRKPKYTSLLVSEFIMSTVIGAETDQGPPGSLNVAMSDEFVLEKHTPPVPMSPISRPASSPKALTSVEQFGGKLTRRMLASRLIKAEMN